MILDKYETFEEYRKAVRELSQTLLLLQRIDSFLEEGIPEDLTDALRDIGLFGISIPSKYGGLGLSMEEQVRLTFEFCQASCVYRSRFSTTIGLTSQAILGFRYRGTERKILTKNGKGALHWCLCFDGTGSRI
ncbi:MAG: hypothetical protein CM15mP62_33710 [Rhodospirillaceae bacterium]|nr:MAG: hypothetical protein CM15mP62_33710 [Rhodospirillaceae bacterium]